MATIQVQQNEEETNSPTTTSRRSVLTELPDGPNEAAIPNKPQSPDEQVIIQRGIRRKPLTWSPYDPNHPRLIDQLRAQSPAFEKQKPNKPEVNMKLRRRLVLS